MAEFSEFIINNMRENLEPEYDDIINRKYVISPQFDDIDSVDSLDVYAFEKEQDANKIFENEIEVIENHNLNHSFRKCFYENDNKCKEVIKSIRKEQQINISRDSLNATEEDQMANKISNEAKTSISFKSIKSINNLNRIQKVKSKKRSIDEKIRVCKITRNGFMPKKFKYSISEDAQANFFKFNVNNSKRRKPTPPTLKQLNENFVIASAFNRKSWRNFPNKYYVNKSSIFLEPNQNKKTTKPEKKSNGINFAKIIFNSNNANSLKKMIASTFSKNNSTKYKTYHNENKNEKASNAVDNENFICKKSKSEMSITNYRPLLIASSQFTQFSSGEHSTSAGLKLFDSSASNSNNFLTSIFSSNANMENSSPQSNSNSISSGSYKSINQYDSSSKKETLNPLYRSSSSFSPQINYNHNEYEKNVIEIDLKNQIISLSLLNDENNYKNINTIVTSSTKNNLNKTAFSNNNIINNNSSSTTTTSTTYLNNNNKYSNNDDVYKIVYNIKHEDTHNNEHVYENVTTLTSSSTHHTNDTTKSSKLTFNENKEIITNSNKSLRPTVKFEINQLIAENKTNNNNNNICQFIYKKNNSFLKKLKNLNNSKKMITLNHGKTNNDMLKMMKILLNNDKIQKNSKKKNITLNNNNFANNNKLNTKIISSLIKNNNLNNKISENINKKMVKNGDKIVEAKVNSYVKNNLNNNHRANSLDLLKNTNNKQQIFHHKPYLAKTTTNATAPVKINKEITSNNYHQIDSNQIYSIISVEKSKIYNKPLNTKKSFSLSTSRSFSFSNSTSLSSKISASTDSSLSKNFYNLKQQSNDNTLINSFNKRHRKKLVKHDEEEENIYSNNTKLIKKLNLFSNKKMIKNNDNNVDSKKINNINNNKMSNSLQTLSNSSPLNKNNNNNDHKSSKINVKSVNLSNQSNTNTNSYQALIQVDLNNKKNNINKQKLLSSWDKIIKKHSKDPASIEKMLKSKSYNKNGNSKIKTNNNNSVSEEITTTNSISNEQSNNNNNNSSGLSNFFKNLKSKNKKEKKNNENKNNNDKPPKIDDDEYEKLKSLKISNSKNNDDYSKINELLLSGVVTAGKQGELIKQLFSYLNSYGEDGFTIKAVQNQSVNESKKIKNLLKLTNKSKNIAEEDDVNKKSTLIHPSPPPPPIQTLPPTSSSSNTISSITDQNQKSTSQFSNSDSSNLISEIESSCKIKQANNKCKNINEKNNNLNPKSSSIFPFYLKCCMDRKIASRSTIGSGVIDLLSENLNDANFVKNKPIVSTQKIPIKVTKEASTSNTDLSFRFLQNKQTNCENINLEKVQEEVSSIENKFKRKDNTIDIDKLIETLDDVGQIDYLRKKLSIYLKTKCNNDIKNNNIINDITDLTVTITSNSIYEKQTSNNHIQARLENNVVNSSHRDSINNNRDERFFMQKHSTPLPIYSNKRSSININETNNNYNMYGISNNLKSTKKSKSYLDLYGDESQFIYDNKDSNKISNEFLNHQNYVEEVKPAKETPKIFEEKVEKKPTIYSDTCQIELKINKETSGDNIKTSIKEANEMKQIMKLIESKESKFVKLKEKIEANRNASTAAVANSQPKKKKSIRSYKTADQLDLDMFYFTSESPTKPTMKKRTQKLLSGFYKQLTGNSGNSANMNKSQQRNGNTYTSFSKPELSRELFGSDSSDAYKETLKKFKTINKIKSNKDGSFYFRVIPNNEEEKTEIIAVNRNESLIVDKNKEQNIFVQAFNSVVSNLDNHEAVKVCSSNLGLIEEDSYRKNDISEALPVSEEVKKIELSLNVPTKKNVPKVEDTIKKYEKLMPKDCISDSEQKCKNKLILNETIRAKESNKVSRFKSDIFALKKNKEEKLKDQQQQQQENANNKLRKLKRSSNVTNCKYEFQSMLLKSKQLHHHHQNHVNENRNRIKKKLRNNSIIKEIKEIQNKPSPLAKPIRIEKLLDPSEKVRQSLKNNKRKFAQIKNIQQNQQKSLIKQQQKSPIKQEKSPVKQQQNPQEIKRNKNNVIENRNSTPNLNANLKRRQSKRNMIKPALELEKFNQKDIKTKAQQKVKQLPIPIDLNKKTNKKVLNKLLEKNPNIIHKLTLAEPFSPVSKKVYSKSNFERAAPKRQSKNLKNRPSNCKK